MFKLKIHYTSVTGRRDSNEDRHNIILNINGDDKNMNKLNFFSIYDGHGGSEVSSYLYKTLPNYYMNKKFKPPFLQNFHERVFETVQQELLKNQYGFFSGSTCLMNIMYKIENKLFMNIANLGDSRLSIVYRDNTSKAITQDHKPDLDKEKKRITDMGGSVYKDSEGVYRIGDLSLSRAFGDGDNKPYISQKPDIYTIEVNDDIKYIVMACDGLWDVVESTEIGNVINKINSQDENIAVNLTNYALNNGSTDNVSVIVIQILK